MELRAGMYLVSENGLAIPFDQMIEFIDTKGKRPFPDPAENTHKLKQVADESYHLT